MTPAEAARNETSRLLRIDLEGPAGGPAETIPAAGGESPLSRYITGILYPPGAPVDAIINGGGLDDAAGRDYAEAEAGISLTNTPNPSSAGITFTVKEGALLKIDVSAGLYAAETDAAGAVLLWRRRPVAELVSLAAKPAPKAYRTTIVPGMELRTLVRRPDGRGAVTVTASMINIRNDAGRHGRDFTAACLFQCRLKISLGEGEAFVERARGDVSRLEPEVQEAALLYRHARTIAVGHGCAAEWELGKEQGAGWVQTAFVPEFDVRRMAPRSGAGLPAFLLRTIAAASTAELEAMFEPLCAQYETWVEAREKEAAAIPVDFQPAAARQVAACRETVKRMRTGICALKNPDVALAFSSAHHAMLHVFAIGRSQDNPDLPTEPDYGADHKWHPFQIAFILQCLESVANPASPDRETADLLWFPTGGGKTEAYLGITAFLLFLRRLRRAEKPDRGGGTAVLMRYTLRLLTADQFARASLMACACEKVRKGHARLKPTAPITIGLWVGEGATPNRIEKAADALKKLHASKPLQAKETNPCKLARCPWCGTALDCWNYMIESVPSRRLAVRCPSKTCDFRTGIPAVTVDDQIYDERPSLVIGTVDKFARIPWVAETGTLFGTDGTTAPPELIIQDELHLISGPLGTLSGLYETAIDLLCEQGGHRPKIVASTATIRNAERQVRALFDRTTCQFPPPCLDARDSFFAVEETDGPARRYVGVFTPGKSGITSYIRTVSGLLHIPAAMKATDGAKDPYWTLMCYFNSLRELGGAIVRVHDDVGHQLEIAAVREVVPPRILQHVVELTGRKGEPELEDVRLALRKSLPADALDCVLCSNMISVGLDVPRLGVMCVVGQPKTTAEYIQATSRIGRRHPGLVVTLYNWTRSRDRSHYERFFGYHSRLYAEVEATSVTPFSPRARDRALRAVLVSVMRHRVPGLGDNAGAAAFSAADPEVLRLAAQVKARIARVEHADPMAAASAAADVDTILGEWESLRLKVADLTYFNSTPQDALLVGYEQADESPESFPAMNNMRNVDQKAGIYLV